MNTLSTNAEQDAQMTRDLPGTAQDVPAHVGGPHEAYLALLAEGILGFQACGSCAGAVFPPRGRCSHCGADVLTWRASAGRGTVSSTTVLSPRDKPPYAVVLIDLDEGYRMMSRIDRADAEPARIDDRVYVRFEPAGDDVLPMFAPDRGDR
jgi:uncharacterized OB-fold protein